MLALIKKLFTTQSKCHRPNRVSDVIASFYPMYWPSETLHLINEEALQRAEQEVFKHE